MATNVQKLANFEIRLREYVSKILAMDQYQMTPSWKSDLGSKTAEYWAAAISVITPQDTKLLLGATEPPNIEQLLQLSVIANDPAGGVYLGVLLSEEGHAHRIYVGSATLVVGALAKRTNDHLSPTYRRDYKK